MTDSEKKIPERSRTELLVFLNSELERQDTEASRTGLTRWVLLAATATLGWEVIRQLTPWPANIYNVIVAIYLMQIGLVILATLPRRLVKAAFRPNPVRVFDPVLIHAVLKQGPFSIGISAAYLSVGVYVFWGESGWFQLLNIGIWGIPILFESVVLFMDKQLISMIPQNVGPRASHSLGIATLLRWGCMIVIAFTLVVSAITGKYEVTDIGLKVGILISAITYLVSELGEMSSNVAISNSIRNLIVKITFGHIALDDAYSRAEALFIGPKLDDILLEEVNEFTKVVDTYLSNKNDGQHKILTFSKRLVDLKYHYLIAKLSTLVLVMNIDKSKIDPLKEQVETKHLEFLRALEKSSHTTV